MSQNFFSPHQRCNEVFAGANYIFSIENGIGVQSRGLVSREGASGPEGRLDLGVASRRVNRAAVRHGLCGLGLSAASWVHAPSTATRNITTTPAVFGKATPSLASWTTLVPTTPATHSTSSSKIASIGICSRSTFLYVNLLSSDGVGVCCNSSVVGSLISKFDERTVLVTYQHRPPT